MNGFDVPSEPIIPRSGPVTTENATEDVVRPLSEEPRDNEDGQTKAQPDAAAAVLQELPTDVRVKLRKLEKLESRHHGWKNYCCLDQASAHGV